MQLAVRFWHSNRNQSDIFLAFSHCGRGPSLFAFSFACFATACEHARSP
jgi:hypothetical protein